MHGPTPHLRHVGPYARADVVELQPLLGHASLETTRRSWMPLPRGCGTWWALSARVIGSSGGAPLLIRDRPHQGPCHRVRIVADEHLAGGADADHARGLPPVATDVQRAEERITPVVRGIVHGRSLIEDREAELYQVGRHLLHGLALPVPELPSRRRHRVAGVQAGVEGQVLAVDRGSVESWRTASGTHARYRSASCW